MQSHWDKLPTIRVVNAGYLLAGMEPERKWQFAPPLVANFFNLIREKTGAVKLATMPGERMEITQVEYQTLKAQYGLTPATQPQTTTPSPAPVVQATETKEQRQDRRLDACEKYGLVMPKSYLGRLPDGVGDVADRESVTRQAFSTDVKAALNRRDSAKREGVTVHRT